jgi:undecaprenyl diphosphate synthase
MIMDGNRRWAKSMGLPVAMGHASGARQVRNIVQACAEREVRFLTLFAFSTENWRRPTNEVSSLLGLLALYLQKEVRDMNAKGVCLKIVGDTSRFPQRIQTLIRDAVSSTASNTVITLTIAANYGGRWDMLQAVKAWQVAHPNQSVHEMNEENLSPCLALAHAPEPDLLIRTGGESRISNFMLWQLAYTEMFFTDVLWPDFSAEELDHALQWFAQRDRRFGSSSTLNLSVA